MNTLGYVARQFDVLASSKPLPTTSPSISTAHRRRRSEHASDPHSPDIPLQRVSTWSTKSFLFSPTPSHSPSAPRRTRSSPSFASISNPPPPATQPAADSMPTRSKPHIESVINQIFFIRVFLVVWDNLKAVWSSLTHHVTIFTWPKPITIEYPPLHSEKDIIKQVQGPILSTTQATEPHVPLPTAKPESTSSSPLIGPSSTVQSPTPTKNSRSSTPILNAKKTPFHLPKTLVLDLDETLIHSTSRPMFSQTSNGSGLLSLGSFGRSNKGAGHIVEVVLGGRSTLYHVYKRPFVDFFLRTVSGWYTLVIFTASMQEYADPVIDWLDAGSGILTHRFFRDSCTQLPNGSYTKDLSIVEADLSRVCLVDNSPVSYRVNEANGIPIEGWTHDPSDEALLDLLPVLDSLRFTSDVRRVLGLRSAGVHHS